MLLVNNKTRVEMPRIKTNLTLTNEIIECGFSVDFEKCSSLSNSHMVHPLSWCDGLSTSMTQRATPAGAYAPGRATHAGQVKG